MIYKIINLPNSIKDRSYKNVGWLENVEKSYSYEEEEILHKKRYMECFKCAKQIQLASKFYISDDYIRFMESNNINMYDINEFANYFFKKPFQDKPLLIQTGKNEGIGLSLLIDFIPKEVKEHHGRQIQKHNLHYIVKAFWYSSSGEIETDINHWLLSEDIFQKFANKENACFYGLTKESLQIKSAPPKEIISNYTNNIQTTLYYYFAATYLKDILPIFETKDVKGRKPFVGSINAKQNVINLPSWEHKIITIKPNILKDMGYDKKDSSGKRLHDVRGHFRHYSNGKISWVAPHKRGNPELGIIKADGYKLDFK